MIENTFKVGDRVRVTLELSERYGQTGVIVNRTQVYRRPIFTYEVEFETENPKGWNKDSFMTHELELVTDEPTPPRNPICNLRLRFPAPYSRFTVTESDEPDVIRTADGDYMDAREYRHFRRSLGLLY